jgi:hypothetical protein
VGALRGVHALGQPAEVVVEELSTGHRGRAPSAERPIGPLRERSRRSSPCGRFAVGCRRSKLRAVVEQFPSGSRSEASTAEADVGRSVDDLVQSQADLAQSRKDLAQSQGDLAQSRHDLAESRADLVAANELSDHLQEALRTSRQIGMAIGILMERHKLTAEQAFDQLREGSSRRNVKLRDIAEQLLFTGEDPTQITA